MKRKYPFSSAVPQIMKHLYLTISRFFAFVTKTPSLNASFGRSGICSGIQESIVHVSQALSTLLYCDHLDTPQSKACQITIDSILLIGPILELREVTAVALEYFGIHSIDEQEVHFAFDKGIVALEQISGTGKDLVFELLTIKIDMLFESLCFLDWGGVDSTQNGPHDEISQIIDFLGVTLIGLAQLPRSSRESIHFGICSRICKSILDYCISSKVSGISMICWLRFDKDVRALESFADSCNITQLRMCFTELRECIAAIMSPELVHIAEQPTRRQAAFPTVDPEKLALLLDKTVQIPVGVIIPPYIPKRNRNELQAIIKSLRKKT